MLRATLLRKLSCEMTAESIGTPGRLDLPTALAVEVEDSLRSTVCDVVVDVVPQICGDVCKRIAVGRSRPELAAWVGVLVRHALQEGSAVLKDSEEGTPRAGVRLEGAGALMFTRASVNEVSHSSSAAIA